MVDVLVEIFSCQLSPGEQSYNLPPKLHHILHAEVRNEQRNLSPSAHSGNNL